MGGGYLSLKDTNTETEVLKGKLTEENLVGVYIESEDGYSKSDTIPESGYVFNENESYCKINDVEDENITLTYDSATKTLSISPITKEGTKCYLYFDKQPSAKDTILSHYPTVLTRTNFSTTITNTTTGTIYKSLNETQYDNDGEVYYFAGNPTDNWVEFGGYWWRIIRINGNGSIRMIYQGTSANDAGSGTVIGYSVFNAINTSGDNMYVGYMYTLNEVHGLGTNSTIKRVLDSWYTSGGLSNYTDQIDGSTGFCGDRTPSSGTGLGMTNTYYAAYTRLQTNKNPSFKCTSESDLYTTNESTNGNKALQYPIGLISADEAAYAGGVASTNNTSYYLYAGQNYWTMSPCSFMHNSVPGVFVMEVNYGINPTWSVDTVSSGGIRPVINLKGDLTITGSGTTTDPYKVEGA